MPEILFPDAHVNRVESHDDKQYRQCVSHISIDIFSHADKTVDDEQKKVVCEREGERAKEVSRCRSDESERHLEFASWA